MPDPSQPAIGRNGQPVKRRRHHTQKTGCPFSLTIKRDKYAPAPGQVWRVQQATRLHNHAGVPPLGFRSERSKLLEAHRESILMMHNDGIRASKMRKYLKLQALPFSDFYNVIRKETEESRQELLATQQRQQLELSQIAGQLDQMVPGMPSTLLGGSGLDELTDEGQLRALMAADREAGEDEDAMGEVEEVDDDEEMGDDDAEGEGEEEDDE